MTRAAGTGPLQKIVSAITEQCRAYPVRVGVDGRTGCGKSTFANQLAHAIHGTGREAIRVSIDDFHRPAAERRMKGRYSPEGYYEDARDLDAFVRLALAPLGPGGDRRFARRSFDLHSDMAVEPEFELAPADSVLIADGTFLQRPELRPHCDFTIFLDVPAATARERAVSRDAERLGGIEEALKLYDLRYAPAFHLYEEAVDPLRLADAVVR